MNQRTRLGTCASISRIARPVCCTSRAMSCGRRSVNSDAAFSKTSARKCLSARDQTPEPNVTCASRTASSTSSVDAAWQLNENQYACSALRLRMVSILGEDLAVGRVLDWYSFNPGSMLFLLIWSLQTHMSALPGRDSPANQSKYSELFMIMIRFLCQIMVFNWGEVKCRRV